MGRSPAPRRRGLPASVPPLWLSRRALAQAKAPRPQATRPHVLSGLRAAPRQEPAQKNKASQGSRPSTEQLAPLLGVGLWAHHSTSAASAGPSLADFGKESLSLSFWRLCDFSLVDESRKRCMLSRACNSREGLTRYSRHKLDMTSTLL